MAAKKVTEESTKEAEVARKKSTLSYEEMLMGFHNIPRKATIGKWYYMSSINLRIAL